MPLSKAKKPEDLVKIAKELGIEFLDFKFLDLPGRWHHTGAPVSELSVDLFEEGIGFDGSSLRAWRSIEASDMLIIPDWKTARLDPFFDRPTLSFICNVVDPVTGQAYNRDPRGVAQRAVSYLTSTGLADTVYVGPEAEFFLFDDVRFDQTANAGYYAVDSDEGAWNSGREERPNLGYKPAMKGGYFPAAPYDRLRNIRQEMVTEMQKLGIVIEAEHHEVGTGGQCEIDMRFDDLMSMADDLQWFKYVVKNVAFRHQKSATFMPKPLFGDNGSGMHTHMSLWKDGVPLFAGDKYAGLSDMALHFIAGILKHGKALVALTNPTTNSYRRLVPGYEAPINLAYSSRNRSASIRIPMYSSSPKAKRVEFRTPDPSCNGYLAFSAILMAGLDGIERRLDPGEPMDKDIYSLPPEERANIPAVPGSLSEALDELENDHAWLTKGNVFSEDLIHSWIKYKRDEEVTAARLRPTPIEFQLYYDT
ncbi:MAG: glutamine synthetase [Bradymonadia bacterium]|jgi:glutamine synthetase